MHYLFAGLLMAVFSTTVFAQVSVPYEFKAGTPARASEVNANFQALATTVNAFAGQNCPANQFLSGFGKDGTMVCSPTGTTMLPSGATLRGIWGPTAYLSVSGISSASQYVTISFPLMLSATPTFGPTTHWMLSSGSTTDCPGVIDGQPEAAPGHLCVYQTNSDASSGVESKGAQWSSLGALLWLTAPAGSGIPRADGVWAVTAP